MAPVVGRGRLGQHPVPVADRDSDRGGGGVQAQQQHAVRLARWLGCDHRGVETTADHSIRPARRGDAERIAEIYAGFVETSASTFEEQALTAAEMLSRMESRPRLPWLVAADAADTVVGFAYASPHHERSAYRWSLTCSVYLHESTQGRSLASALYRELFDVVRDLGMTMFAGIVLPNDASVAVHERVGFRPVGVYPRLGFKLAPGGTSAGGGCCCETRLTSRMSPRVGRAGLGAHRRAFARSERVPNRACRLRSPP